MPEISRFYGLVILNYNDHNPPHFHVRYGSQRAVIGIELGDAWRLARDGDPLAAIAPLE
jgi:hypothetical protein